MENILNRFTIEHSGILTISSLVITIMSFLFAIYGIYLAKKQSSGISITISAASIYPTQPTHSPNKYSFADSLLDGDNFWLIAILLALIGSLVKGKYSSLALLFSMSAFFVCFLVVIFILAKTRSREALLNKYLLLFLTFLFSALSIWGFAFPLFDQPSVGSDIDLLLSKILYYIFSGTGYGLCVICMIGCTFSFVKQIKQPQKPHRSMRTWLFFSILGCLLQSGILSALMYHILDFH